MLEAIELDRDSSRPLHRQLYSALCELILSGNLSPGTRLPSTRSVALELGVSRNTVVTAFEQLAAEGFVDLKVGVGTRVSDVGQTRPAVAAAPIASQRLGVRGQRLSRPPTVRHSDVDAPFVTGVPDVSEFPRSTWARLLARHARASDTSLMGYAHAGGYEHLREVLSTYLRTSRGVRCTPNEVIVMNAAQSGLDLAARLVVDSGDVALVEDPGYPGARAALEGAGLQVEAVRVDDDGFDIARANRDDAKLVCVTPSHQFPTGVTMTVPRRLALLEWAERQQSWIIEDDYDSEFHYDVRPIPSLQGLADTRQVIYLGTFAKTLLPAMRIAYAVVPADLAAGFRQAIRHTGQEPALLIQAALAAFIDEGHFARHLRRMRRLYESRRRRLVESLETHMHDTFSVVSSSGGLQLCISLEDDTDDVAIADTAGAAGLGVQPLSAFCVEESTRRGLILGFAATDESRIDDAVLQLSKIMRR